MTPPAPTSRPNPRAPANAGPARQASSIRAPRPTIERACDAVAVIVGFGLAALTATRPGRPPAVLGAIALIALAWAALDVREAVHQVDESRTGIAMLAIAVAALHLAAALLAGRMAARSRHADARTPDHPGTMPA